MTDSIKNMDHRAAEFSISGDYHGLNQLGHTFSNLGRLKRAMKCFNKSLELNQDQPVVAFNLAVACQTLDQTEKSIQYYQLAVQLDPNFAKAHANLGYVMHSLGKYQEATDHLEIAAQIAPDDAQIRHMLSAVGGAPKPPQASDDYVRHIFDNYAKRFDTHLVEDLHYRTPEILLDCFLQEHRNGKSSSLDILDLGCGTGLCGTLIKPYAKYLSGVDLSKNMINEARQKGIYDKLTVSDISGYLDEEADYFDVVIAADVFIYIGDLTEVFSKTFDHLRDGGLFIFSTEKPEQDSADYTLLPTGRYAQSPRYIETLCKTSGLVLVNSREDIIRLQDKRPITGYLFTLRKLRA